MNGIDGLPTTNCMNSITFIRRFALKPTYYTRARGECITCNYTTDPNSPVEKPCPFTSEQLAMRRKAEILQYKNNANFTGALTKAQKYSLIAKRKGPNQKTYGTQTQTHTNPNSTARKATNPLNMPIKMVYNNLNQIPKSFVPEDRKKCPIPKTSTHSSGVPGPEMKLFMDENVPLTDYIVRRNYSGNHGASNFVFKVNNITDSQSNPVNTIFRPSTDSD